MQRVEARTQSANAHHEVRERACTAANSLCETWNRERRSLIATDGIQRPSAELPRAFPQVPKSDLRVAKRVLRLVDRVPKMLIAPADLRLALKICGSRPAIRESAVRLANRLP